MIWAKIAFILACLSATAIVAGLALSVGDRAIPFLHVYEVVWDRICGAEYIFDSSEWWDDYIICDVRMPRVVMGIITGASLALGGVVMQSMMMNPLADPYTTGISSGACFGAVAAIVMGASFSTAVESYGIVTNAFIGCLIPAFIIIAIATRVRATPVTLILAGTAISYMFNALTTIIMVAADESKLSAAYSWQIGSLSNAAWNQIPVMLAVVVAGSIFMIVVSNRLDLMMLGDDNARSLGLDVGKFRMLCLIILSFLTASVISFTGIIGFVGLVVPHMARFFIGSGNRFLVPASMALGALTVICADLVARVISVGSVPVGIVMSFAGGFMFLVIVLRQNCQYGDVP